MVNWTYKRFSHYKRAPLLCVLRCCVALNVNVALSVCCLLIFILDYLLNSFSFSGNKQIGILDTEKDILEASVTNGGSRIY